MKVGHRFWEKKCKYIHERKISCTPMGLFGHPPAANGGPIPQYRHAALGKPVTVGDAMSCGPRLAAIGRKLCSTH